MSNKKRKEFQMILDRDFKIMLEYLSLGIIWGLAFAYDFIHFLPWATLAIIGITILYFVASKKQGE